MKFEHYRLTEQIKTNLAELGFKKPTDIQYKSIPPILKGEDLFAVAQTGTGKTAAFAIPIIDKIHSRKSSRRTDGVKVLVMVPTRELAIQLESVFNSIAAQTKVLCYAITGGQDLEEQKFRLERGIDILIATPGRMFDLINQKILLLDLIDTVILDEADRMLDLGFVDDIRYVKSLIKGYHQTLFFSATLNPSIKKIAFSLIRGNAIRIQISPKNPVSKNVYHRVMFVEMDDKRFFLRRFLEEHPEDKIIIFVRTRVRAERVKKAMERGGFESETIHGEREQDDRNRVMQDFRDGKLKLMIATDVSARGIDIPDITFVINYDLPELPENYVHRVGRTGRGFNKGVALSFCSEGEKEQLKAIEEYINEKVVVREISKQGYQMTLEIEEKKQVWLPLLNEMEIFQKKSKSKPKGSKKNTSKGKKKTVKKNSSKRRIK